MAKADVGCSVGDGYIYYGYKGDFWGIDMYKKSSSQRITLAAAYCEETTGDYCLLERTSGSSNYDVGSVYYFSFVNCPLDEHTDVALALSAGFGLFFLRRKKK